MKIPLANKHIFYNNFIRPCVGHVFKYIWLLKRKTRFPLLLSFFLCVKIPFLYLISFFCSLSWPLNICSITDSVCLVHPYFLSSFLKFLFSIDFVYNFSTDSLLMDHVIVPCTWVFVYVLESIMEVFTAALCFISAKSE